MRYIILIDGGFIKKKHFGAFGVAPSASDIRKFGQRLVTYNRPDDVLIRIYYYDSPPLHAKLRRPVSGSTLDLGKTALFSFNQNLLSELKRSDSFAVREGRLALHGWKLKPEALGKLSRDRTDDDFAPEIQQKGVDMKIGLDIAWISFKRIADRILIVAGDSDFIPAMKLARRNGIQVYLFTLGHGVFPELLEHSDRLIDTQIHAV